MAFRVLDGKLQATGELSLFFFYEEESETKKTVWYETTVPVSVAIECAGVREGMLEQIGCSIGHLEIEAKADEDGEERVNFARPGTGSGYSDLRGNESFDD